jgi:hypothetical protein
MVIPFHLLFTSNYAIRPFVPELNNTKQLLEYYYYSFRSPININVLQLFYKVPLKQKALTTFSVVSA